MFCKEGEDGHYFVGTFLELMDNIILYYIRGTCIYVLWVSNLNWISCTVLFFYITINKKTAVLNSRYIVFKLNVLISISLYDKTYF